MWAFIERHPYLSTLLIVPTVAMTGARIVHAGLAKVGVVAAPPTPSTDTKAVL
jgi:hypothetical protein